MIGIAELPPLAPDDALGRSVFDSAKARRAVRKGIIDHRVFLERPGVLSLSVDRLGHASLDEMVAISDEAAAARGRNFHGWATVLVREAELDGRTVEPTPELTNRFHADIHLNIAENDEELRDKQTQHAHSLALLANWLPHPAVGPEAD